jgi:putative cell wall-binding protein
MAARERRIRVTAGLLAIATAAMIWGVSARTADAAPVVTRVSGADRYATAVAISAGFAPNVPVAYVTTGETFPDALAAAPAAAKKVAPILLTQPNALPDVTGAELDRLKPAKIVLIGGVAAVSQGVEDALRTHTLGPVERLQGANRFATAAAISAATFPANVSTVYIATGMTFPDGLTGGPAVAHAPNGGGPLLLVTPDVLPSETAAELTRLNPQKVVVLGGTGAVTDAVKDQLESYSIDAVERRSGADRYLTAVDVSSKAFASAAKVYLATGVNFPDALAGGSVAGIAGAPILLAQPTCIPASVNAEIDRLAPQQVIVLGGTSALSDAVVNRTTCPPPTTTTVSPVTSTPPTVTVPQTGVTPGAFCTPAGATGVTSTGLPMTCATHKCDGTAYEQPHWRSAICS